LEARAQIKPVKLITRELAPTDGSSLRSDILGVKVGNTINQAAGSARCKI
jgi:hypothetical protein